MENQNELLDAIKYINDNKLTAESNSLANKIGSARLAALMIYRQVPQTAKNIREYRKAAKLLREMEALAWERYLEQIRRECREIREGKSAAG